MLTGDSVPGQEGWRVQGPSWTARGIGGVRPEHGSPARALAVRALADWPELARALVAERAFLRRQLT